YQKIIVSGSRVRYTIMHIINRLYHLRAQLYMKAADIFLKLLHVGGADNIARQERPGVDKSQGHLRQTQIMSICNFEVFTGSLLCRRPVVSVELLKLVDAGIRPGGSPMIFAAQQTKSQRRISQ